MNYNSNSLGKIYKSLGIFNVTLKVLTVSPMSSYETKSMYRNRGGERKVSPCTVELIYQATASLRG